MALERRSFNTALLRKPTWLVEMLGLECLSLRLPAPDAWQAMVSECVRCVELMFYPHCQTFYHSAWEKKQNMRTTLGDASIVAKTHIMVQVGLHPLCQHSTC